MAKQPALARWLGTTWRPRIRQRQWLKHQELSPPADLRPRPRHARPWTVPQHAAAWLATAVIAAAVVYVTAFRR